MATELAKFDFQQGFNRETTQYAEGQRWYDGNYVRFRAGRPENMRGYETRSSTTFDGSARALITWTDTDVKQEQSLVHLTSYMNMMVIRYMT
jgi:hypothetical protein